MKQTLGQDRTGACGVCQQPFAKTRFDARFCSAHCRKIGRKTLYEKTAWALRPDRLELNEARKARYAANRSEETARHRQWRSEHPEEARAKDKAAYERNKPSRLAATYAYRKLHPEIRKKEYRNARQKRPWEQCLINARHRSLKKKMPFDLTREWCESNWAGTCSLSGLPFVFGTRTHYPFSPSLDRIDSSKGYIQGNCRFILFALNSFKGMGTDEQMLEIAKSLILHQKAAPARLNPQKPETDFAVMIS